MKTQILTILSIATLSGMVGIANASDFNYNYVEGTYQDIDADGIDGETYQIAGSYELTPSVNILAEYKDGQLDTAFRGRDVEFDQSAIGVGFHTGVTNRTDFTANIKVVDLNSDMAGDDTGYGVGVGVRHMVTNKVEVGTKIDYVDVNDVGDTTLNVNSRFHLNDKLSFGASYSTSEESNDTVSGGVRFSF